MDRAFEKLYGVTPPVKLATFEERIQVVWKIIVKTIASPSGD